MTHTISALRILERCDALARCSEAPDKLTRVYLSPEMRAASELTLSWMREAGMSVHVDTIGNVCGRYEGAAANAPALLLGSHLDTVRDAGKYDGMLGVVSAIECVAALASQGKRLPFAIEVIGFADEEGVRFGSTLIGSRAVAGTFKPETLNATDTRGVTLREALREYGLDPDHVNDAARHREEILAFVELHIEQGPVLESLDLPVGVVTAINGATRFQIEIAGVAGHAGTVPMHLRHDALTAAAECVLAIEARARAEADLVATVGKLETLPGAINVIPGKVRFTLDVRAPADAQRRKAASDIAEALHAVCATRAVQLSITVLHENTIAGCAPWLMQQLDSAAAREGIPVHRLPSGAGHDGMAIQALSEIGMLFVRCKAGISHNPAESVTSQDVEAGARVLLGFIENFQPKQP
jgi:allantoate deiminase